jgi:hypothetical protein
MTPCTPRIENFNLPIGTVPVTFAKDQPEYLPLPALRTPNGAVVTQWAPTADELRKLNAGEPVTLAVLTFGQPLQPLIVDVGSVDLSEF